jgi:hypothetical protein
MIRHLFVSTLIYHSILLINDVNFPVIPCLIITFCIDNFCIRIHSSTTWAFECGIILILEMLIGHININSFRKYDYLVEWIMPITINK